MTSTRRFNRRWAAPAIALLVVAGIGVGPDLLGSAGASAPDLPALTPAELLAKARTAQVTALSGTVQLTSNLGLPSLDSLGSLGGGGSGTSVASLLAGSHSADVWIDGADHVRVTTTAPMAETNWIRNGTDLWSYDSSTLTTTHATLPADTTGTGQNDGGTGVSLPDPAHDTPIEFAQRLLDEVTPSTDVSVGITKVVAGWPVYQLVLTPHAADTTVGHVTFAIDAATGLPLDVTVEAKSTGSTALELGFTSISFDTPSTSTFDFTPPPDSTVVEAKNATALLGAGGRTHGEGRHGDGGGSFDYVPNGLSGGNTTMLGSDWSSVLVLTGSTVPAQLGSIISGAPEVTVGSTSGHLITTTLFNVLVLSDGRVAIGAVTPEALEAAVAGSAG
jgi:outer membrane lipoprotein-sorting protein